MNNKNLFLALLAFFVNLPIMAYDFVVDSVAYNITSADALTVEVTAGDNNGFYHDDVVIPSTVTYGGVVYTVTAIGENAFYRSPMTSISLPNTLRTIGGYNFYYCNQLKSLTIPEGVETMTSHAIVDCAQLEEVSFPSTMTNFGFQFGYTRNLKTVKVAKGNPKYDSRDNCNAVIETATNTLLRACSGTTIPNTIETIEEYSFSYLTLAYDDVYLPESVKRIKGSHFCTFKNLYVKDWETFCEINYREGPYRDWYMNPLSYENLYIDNQLVEGDIVFPNTVKGCDLLRDYSKVESIHIPSSFEYVTECMFRGSSVKTVTFDEGAIEIGEEAFKDCKLLTKVQLPSTIREIGLKAFSGCNVLKSFRIPANVQKMDENVFAECPSLAVVVLEGNEPPVISDNTFSNDTYSNATLYVPSGTKSLYEQTTGWKNFKMIVDDEEPNEDMNFFFEDGGLCYHVTSTKDMEVEITYNSEMEEDDSTTEIVIPEKVTDKSNGLTFKVIGIEGGLHGTSVKSVRIPKTIRYIKSRSLSPTWDIKIEDLSLWCKIDFIGGRFYEQKNNFTDPWMQPYLDRKLYVNDQLVTDLVIPDGVTSISDAAFFGFKSIKSVTFAPSVKYIGTMAFDHTSVEKVVIPSNVERISNRAFAGCFDLKELTIENGVKEIGPGAFGDCLDLTKVSIPGSVKVINNFAFRCCKSLKELTLADGIEEIGEWAFTQCENLETVSVPKSVKSIGRHTFNGCKSLTNIYLSEGLESIDRYAFTNCSSLKSLTIPATVTFIGRNVIEDCPHLQSLTIATNNPTYDSRDGGNIIYETATNTIVAVAPNASIPQGLETIGNYAFAYCRDRQSVSLPESVKTIGDYAFLYCWSLHTITIPESVTSIGYRAFEACEGLESVVAMSSQPCQLNEEAFTPRTFRDATLYVPDGTENRYRAADGWKKFKQIEGYSAWLLGVDPISDNNARRPIIKTDGHRILLSNLSANERVSVYRLNGSLVKAVNAAPDGKAILVFPERGIYIVRTMETAKKVTL